MTTHEPTLPYTAVPVRDVTIAHAMHIAAAFGMAAAGWIDGGGAVVYATALLATVSQVFISAYWR